MIGFKNLLCCSWCRALGADQFDEIFDEMGLPNTERNILRARFQRILRSTNDEYRACSLLLTLFMNVITVGTVLITTFTSMQKISGLSVTASDALYWTTVILSILVVIASKLVVSFDLQKKSIIDRVSLEKYKSEGWHFVSSTGRYDSKTLDDRFRLFVDRIEKLRMKTISSLASSGKTSSSSAVNNAALYMGAPHRDNIDASRPTLED